MLKKLECLENIGRFATLKHRAPQLTKLSLIFARNGYGKSTVCATLRSAAESDPNHILARHRLSSINPPLARLHWHPHGMVTFSSGAWSMRVGNVHIFDQEFVHQNIHVADSVTRDNKRSLLPIVLGEQGVLISEQIVIYDKEQRELDKEIKELARLIRANVPVITDDKMLAFCEREVPADIDDRVRSAEKALELAKEAKAVQQKSLPKRLPISDYDSYKALLAKAIAGVSQIVADRVAEHIEKHKLLPPNGNRWIAYGQEHIVDSKCPFCAQDIAGNKLVDSYQTYYSEELSKLLQEIDQMKDGLDQLLDHGHLSRQLADNDADYDFWSKVTHIGQKPTLTRSDIEPLVEGLQQLQQYFAKKSANPLTAIALDDQANTIDAALEIAAGYNRRCNDCESTINESKLNAKGSDVESAQYALERWKALANKRKEPLRSCTTQFVMAKRRAKVVEEEKKAKQKKLTDYAATTMSTWQTKINELLSDFGADFLISKTKANFKGREPNTDYAICLNGTDVIVGEKIDDKPSFKTVLSAGDKSTLALAFFIAKLETDRSLGQSLVVFDDPFNSQDMHRQFETSSRIRALLPKAAQVIVLSHDPRFLALIEKDADRKHVSTFQLLSTDAGGGSLERWSSTEELKEEYVRQSEIIREYAHQGNLLKDVTSSAIAMSIRPFLEGYLRARFPGRFNDDANLYVMTEAFESAGQNDPMFANIGELRALNEYSRRYMHAGANPPEPKELRTRANKVMRIVGGY